MFFTDQPTQFKPTEIGFLDATHTFWTADSCTHYCHSKVNRTLTSQSATVASELTVKLDSAKAA